MFISIKLDIVLKFTVNRQYFSSNCREDEKLLKIFEELRYSVGSSQKILRSSAFVKN